MKFFLFAFAVLAISFVSFFFFLSQKSRWPNSDAKDISHSSPSASSTVVPRKVVTYVPKDGVASSVRDDSFRELKRYMPNATLLDADIDVIELMGVRLATEAEKRAFAEEFSSLTGSGFEMNPTLAEEFGEKDLQILQTQKKVN